MSHRRLALLGVVVGVIGVWLVPVVAQTPAAVATTGAANRGTVLRTPWGAPDLQGIWKNDVVVPFERAKEYGTRQFLTEQEHAALEQKRLEADRILLDRLQHEPRAPTAERDVAGAYNRIFRDGPTEIGKRTSQVIDPPDGRIPPMVPERAKQVAAYRQFQVSLLQATDTCKRQISFCKDWKYDPRRSPNLKLMPPIYNWDRLNRADGPEDRSSSGRCLGMQLPAIGEPQRIVQSPDAVSIFYDIAQGHGFSRVIPISATPHLPSTVRQRFGDARGHWEGDTLVVDITNFTHKTDFRGSRENLHLIERYARTDANTLTYQVTVEDPTTWIRPWTAIVELTKQDERPNQIYQQTCHEGNYGLTGILSNMRAVEKAFAEGRGPDPATQDSASPGGDQSE